MFMYSLLPVFSDSSISLGSAGDLELSDPYPFYPDLRLLFGTDLFSPLSKEWSLFFSGGVNGFFRPTDLTLRYLYSVALAASFRDGDFFFKSSFTAKGEQFYAPTPALPDVFQNNLELRFSYDVGDVTIFFNPVLSYTKEELLEDNILLSGEIGATFLVSERFIATGKIKGLMTAIPLHYSEYSGVLEFDFSYYPDNPLILNFSLGTSINSSNYSEIVNGVSVKRWDDTQFFISGDISASLSETLLLKVFIPVKLSLKSMQSVRAGVLSGEPEWTLVIAPEIELSLILMKHHTLVFVVKGEPFFSNSDYYENGYIEFSLSYQIDF
jgi:hypothetical protein